MKWNRIAALMYRDFLTMKGTKYRLIEVVYFPITTIVIWGLFSLFASSFAVEAGLIVFVVNIFWNFALLAQSNTNQIINEDTWSGSMKHLFISGITKMEYLVARLLSSTLIAIAMLAVLFALAIYAFNLTLISQHASLVLFFSAATLVSSIALAVVVSALILVFGREYGFLAWTFLQAFILLSAPFYPVSIFPEALQPVAWAMPFTNIFEGIRSLVATGAVADAFIINSVIVTAVYFALSFPFYAYAFNRARRTGTLARMG